MSTIGDIRIGVSGWRYAGWRGQFYPDGLRQSRELDYLSSRFRTVEINGTFYSLQRPKSFAAWSSATPPGFIFAVKGSRYITHMLRLTRIERPLANFFASGVLLLRERQGPFLWQLPPQVQFDAERLERFFALLPRDTEEAGALARGHDRRVSGRSVLQTDQRRPLRHAIEVRHETFVDPAFVRLARKYRIAIVCADSVGWPQFMDVTSDFIYCRLHGDKELYASGYGDKALARWSERVIAWASGQDAGDAKLIVKTGAPKRRRRDVYVYFDNDAKVRAPADAAKLVSLLRRRRAKA